MGILSRAADILSANINALLDKAEDPVKMANKYLADYMDKLAECKKDAATIAAQEKAAQREYDNAMAEVKKYTTWAQNAVAAGNDDDARRCIAKKQAAEQNAASKKALLDAAHANTVKITDVYNKLVDDIAVLRQKVNDVKATSAIADAHETVAGIMDKYGAGSSGAAGIDRMLDKAQARMDRASASIELSASVGSEEDELAKKYGSSGSSPAVDDELAAMKAALQGGVN